MSISRETIFSALFDLLCATTPPAAQGGVWNTTSRDLKLWSDVEPADQPALVMVQNPQHASMEVFAANQWKLSATAWIYYQTDALSNPSAPRDTAVNNFIDAIDAAINPMAGIPQTLGGLVLHTYIDGAVVFDNGLTDQQAVILVPITMLVAAFGA
jgi:hypothetical protein